MMPFSAPKALTITSAEIATAPPGPTSRSKVSALCHRFEPITRVRRGSSARTVLTARATRRFHSSGSSATGSFMSS